MLREDPWSLFRDWMEVAERSEPNDPNAMALATAGTDGLPDVRVMLLKAFDERGFVFFTNVSEPPCIAFDTRPEVVTIRRDAYVALDTRNDFW